MTASSSRPPIRAVPQCRRSGDGDSAGADLRIAALGSGSDYSPFLQHVGIASLNMGYGGEDRGGIYHSIYDDFYWYTHFSDTSFVYGRALAQTAGITIMRLADADIIPFAFTNLTATAKRYTKELQELRDDRAKEILAKDRAISEGAYVLASDPRDPTTAPAHEAPPPQFNFAPLLNALDSLNAAATHFEKAYGQWERGGDTSAAALARVNAALLRSERVLTSMDGLPKRPWYRHLLYAPGYYTGYGVKTMPGAREAIEQGEWNDVDAQIARIAGVLMAEATVAHQAAMAFEPAK